MARSTTGRLLSELAIAGSLAALALGAGAAVDGHASTQAHLNAPLAAPLSTTITADGTQSSTSTTTTTTSATTTSTSESASETSTSQTQQSTTDATESTSTTSTAVSGSGQQTPTSGSGEPEGTQTTTSTQTTTVAPEAVSQRPQRETAGGGAQRPGRQRESASEEAAKHGARPRSSQSAAAGQAGAPGLPTPPLPFSLRAPISGVPSFFIETLSVPPFLLPIYQAAGIAYDVPWEVLAAINEVETDYGRDLSISSAGAEGWMQFMPQEWRRYGVDATGSGYADPYNPADAIFAAARYLAAAGAHSHIQAAVYAYNHSQAYVASVMMRAQLLSGMPPELLAALISLTEARFPVHAPSHFSDGFPEVSDGHGHLRSLVGTTIYSQSDAPVIAAADGTVTATGQSPTLGRYVRIRDAYGNSYTYAELGSVASLYPVLSPRTRLPAARRSLPPGPPPTSPASAGVQRHSPLSAAATTSGFAFGMVEELRQPPPAAAAGGAPRVRARQAAPSRARSFTAGLEHVTLRPLTVGVHVIAGTILGHLASEGEAHMLFQIRPAGVGVPLIDPKPILDGWVALEDTQIFKAKGEDPFFATSPTAGQALLESEGQLQQQVLRDRGLRLAPCARAQVQAGHVGRQVLAVLELLSVSGLNPTAAGLGCGGSAGAIATGHHRGQPSGAAGLAHGGQRSMAPQPSFAGAAIGRADSGESVAITAINGSPVTAETGVGGLDDAVERKLMSLQGTMQPTEIAGPVRYPSARGVRISYSANAIDVSFASPGIGGGLRGVRATASRVPAALSPSAWQALITRLAQIPSPTVASVPSAAAIPDAGSSAEAGG